MQQAPIKLAASEPACTAQISSMFRGWSSPHLASLQCQLSKVCQTQAKHVDLHQEMAWCRITVRKVRQRIPTERQSPQGCKSNCSWTLCATAPLATAVLQNLIVAVNRDWLTLLLSLWVFLQQLHQRPFHEQQPGLAALQPVAAAAAASLQEADSKIKMQLG